MDPMPKQTLEHFTHPGHQLEQVHAKTEYTCAGCKTFGKGSSYQCSSKSCYYVLHDYCGTCPPSLPSFMHPHPLTRVVRKPQQSTRQNDPCCDVCREPVEGLFYRCKDCDFNVHPLCTLLPQLLRHPLDQSHPLIFEAPVLPSPCSVCGAECSSWRYRCGVCVLDIHLECLLKPCVPPTQQRSVLPLGPNPNHPPPYPLRPPPPPPYGHPAPYPPPPPPPPPPPSPSPSPSPYGHPPPYPPPPPSPYGHPPPYPLPYPPPPPYGHPPPYPLPPPYGHPPPYPPPPPPPSPYGHPPPYPPPLPYGHPPPYPPPSPSPSPSPSPYGHPPPYLQPPPYGHPPPPPYGGYGSGSGSGSAYGYGNGNGNGYGVPSGYGDGNGYEVPSGHGDNYNMYNNGNQAQEHGEKFKKFGKRMFLLVAQLTLGVVSNGIFGLAFPTGFSI